MDWLASLAWCYQRKSFLVCKRGGEDPPGTAPFKQKSSILSQGDKYLTVFVHLYGLLTGTSRQMMLSALCFHCSRFHKKVALSRYWNNPALWKGEYYYRLLFNTYFFFHISFYFVDNLSLSCIFFRIIKNKCIIYSTLSFCTWQIRAWPAGCKFRHRFSNWW